MSFELLKELVAFASALISFTTALNNGQTLQRAGVPIDPVKWGALCFALGAAFVAALFVAVTEQSFVPVGSREVVQWGGLFGFLGAVLGLISHFVIKKEARAAVAEVASAGEEGVVTPTVVYRYPEIIYVERARSEPPIDWQRLWDMIIVCGTICFVVLLVGLTVTVLVRGH
jgi:hypothetical protein